MSDFTIVRQSLIEWYPVSESDNVLIVGEEEGFMDSLFTKRTASVQCVNDSATLSSLADRDDKYDLILVYDLYKYCMESNVTVADVVRGLSSLLTKSGALFLAMENKLGLKYFAGCQEEQEGSYFAGIENYEGWSDIRPLSKHELISTLNAISDISYKFYYPYPDYKYPTMIFSDDCLPGDGELNRNLRNIGKDRYIVFDERKVFDSLINANLFPEFSNSFLVKITAGGSVVNDELIYTKYSTDRNPKYAIRTDRIRVAKDDASTDACNGASSNAGEAAGSNSPGNELIAKVALYDEGKAHLQHMVDMCEALSQRYGDKMVITGSHIDGDKLYNDFAKGVPYTDTFIRILRDGDKEALTDEIRHFIDVINYSTDGLNTFRVTDEFKNVFGKYDNITSFGFTSAKVNDVDMIFDNIIVADDGTWQLIDYEWTFDFPIPQGFIVYRALYFFYQRYNVNDVLPWAEVLDMINVNTECEAIFNSMEAKLSEYITSGVKPLEREIIESDVKVVPFDDMRARFDFYDTGIECQKELKRVTDEYNASVIINKNIKGELEAKKNELNSYRKSAEKTSIAYNKLKDQYVIEQNELEGYRNSLSAKLKRKLK